MRAFAGMAVPAPVFSHSLSRPQVRLGKRRAAGTSSIVETEMPKVLVITLAIIRHAALASPVMVGAAIVGDPNPTHSKGEVGKAAGAEGGVPAWSVAHEKCLERLKVAADRSDWAIWDGLLQESLVQRNESSEPSLQPGVVTVRGIAGTRRLELRNPWQAGVVDGLGMDLAKETTNKWNKADAGGGGIGGASKSAPGPRGGLPPLDLLSSTDRPANGSSRSRSRSAHPAASARSRVRERDTMERKDMFVRLSVQLLLDWFTKLGTPFFEPLAVFNPLWPLLANEVALASAVRHLCIDLVASCNGVERQVLAELVGVLRSLHAHTSPQDFSQCVLRVAIALMQLERRHPGIMAGRALAAAVDPRDYLGTDATGGIASKPIDAVESEQALVLGRTGDFVEVATGTGLPRGWAEALAEEQRAMHELRLAFLVVSRIISSWETADLAAGK